MLKLIKGSQSPQSPQGSQDKDILSYFASPTKTPRQTQKDVLEQVDALFQKGIRYVVLEAPCGSGKSHVSATLARKYGSTYICTLTKSLQTQYATEPDFAPLGLKELKGASTFKCKRCKDTCKTGRHLYTGDDSCENTRTCPYMIAKKEALSAPICVCNYYSFLYNVQGRDGEELDEGKMPKTRSLLVLDEAHEVERVLMDYVGITIKLDKIPGRFTVDLPEAVNPWTPAPVEKYFEWLKELDEHLSELAKDGVSVQQAIEVSEMRGKISYAWSCKDREQWAVDLSSKGSGFELKPVTVGSFGGKFFKYADRVLLMSGTILDPFTLCQSLGIPPDEADYVTVPCTFPVENRPIISFNLPMNKDSREASWPVMVDGITQILRHHGNEKGLLLCPSNEMLNYLRARLPRDCSCRLLIAFGENREAQLAKHLNGSAPTVLSASGMWEGVDLFGNRSRFQILPAMPRPYLSNQVKARMKIHPAWYGWRTCTRMLQGTMRSIRSDQDSAVTYIFDADWRVQCSRKGGLIPSWIKEAVQYQ